MNNLITVDIEEVIEMGWALATFCSSVVELALILYMITLQLGSDLYNGYYVLGGGFLLNAFLGIVILTAYGKMLGRKDRRVELTQDVIEGIKSIKYFRGRRFSPRRSSRSGRPSTSGPA